MAKKFETEVKRVLICEDDQDIAALLRLLLEQFGLAVDIASDAAVNGIKSNLLRSAASRRMLLAYMKCMATYASGLRIVALPATGT